MAEHFHCINTKCLHILYIHINVLGQEEVSSIRMMSKPKFVFADTSLILFEVHIFQYIKCQNI